LGCGVPEAFDVSAGGGEDGDQREDTHTRGTATSCPAQLRSAHSSLDANGDLGDATLSAATSEVGGDPAVSKRGRGLWGGSDGNHG
jgi:hypothetical protein